MRPYLPRGTLRAASRLLGTNPAAAPLAPPAAPRPPAVPARACTSSSASSAVSPDPAAAAKPPSSSAAAAAAAAPAVEAEPAAAPLQPLDEHAHPLPPADAAAAATAVAETGAEAETEAAAAASDGAAAPAAAAEPASHSQPRDPAVLLEQLRELLGRNAVRSALFHFTAALRTAGAPAVDPAVLKLMLPVLGRQSWAASAQEALMLSLDRGYNLTSGLYNCGLHAMSRTGDFKAVGEITDRMWALPPESRPNATSYNYLIGSHMYRGSVDQAFEVLTKMKEHLIYPTFATYHSLITGCLRSHDPHRAYSTLIAVESQRFDVGAMTITQVLVACADADLVDETHDLLNRSVEALPRYAAEVHRIAETRLAYRMARLQRTSPEERATIRGAPRIEMGAIQAIMVCAFRNGNAELAMAGWTALKKNYPDSEVEPAIWYCLIGAFGRSGDYNRAIDALGVMRESGLKPNMRDLENALIKPMSADMNILDEQYYRLCDRKKGVVGGSSRASDAAEASESPEASEITESIESTEAADSPVASESLEAASAVNEDPAAKDISPENEPVEVTGEAKEDEDATESNADDGKLSLREILSTKGEEKEDGLGWEEMVPSTVGIEELNTIIWACSKGGDLDRAFQTYDEVERTFELKRNEETFNALLEGCVEVRHVRGGMRILVEMDKSELPVSGETVHLVSRLLTRTGRLDEAIELLERTVGRGEKVPLKTFGMMVRYLVKGDDATKAAHLFKMGIDHGHSKRGLFGRLDGEGAKALKAAMNFGEEELEVDGDNAQIHEDAESSVDESMSAHDDSESKEGSR